MQQVWRTADSRVRRLSTTLMQRMTVNSASEKVTLSGWHRRSMRTGMREQYAARPDIFRSAMSKFLLLFRRRLRTVDCGTVPGSLMVHTYYLCSRPVLTAHLYELSVHTTLVHRPWIHAMDTGSVYRPVLLIVRFLHTSFAINTFFLQHHSAFVSVSHLRYRWVLFDLWLYVVWVLGLTVIFVHNHSSKKPLQKHICLAARIFAVCFPVYITHTRLMALFPGLPGWASTRKVKPIWILLKQETVSGSGISWAMQVCISL